MIESSSSTNDCYGDIFTAGIIVGLALGKVENANNDGFNLNFIRNKTLKQTSLFKTNEEGRIIGLRLGKWLAEWSLPGVIELLIFLKDLRLRSCMSIPFEVQNLKCLKSLQLVGCNIIIFGKIFMIPSLKDFEIRNCVVRCQCNGNYKCWEKCSHISTKRHVIRNVMEKGFPNLEHFAVHDTSRNFNNDVGKLVFKELVNNSSNCCFRESLKSLVIARSNWNDKTDLATVLLQIVPQFPNLKRLEVKCNRLQSVLPLIEMIEQNMDLDDEKTNHGVVRVKLVCADNVPGIPAIELAKTDPAEKAAVLRLLHKLPGLYNLGCHSYDPEIEYELKLNHIGKGSIVNGSVVARNVLTLKLWPLILDSNRNFLHGVYSTTTIKKKKQPDRRVEDATFIYRLLHDIPQLVERPTSF